MRDMLTLCWEAASTCADVLNHHRGINNPKLIEHVSVVPSRRSSKGYKILESLHSIVQLALFAKKDRCGHLVLLVALARCEIAKRRRLCSFSFSFSFILPFSPRLIIHKIKNKIKIAYLLSFSGHGVSLNQGLILANLICAASSALTSLCKSTSCPIPQFEGVTILWCVHNCSASNKRKTS